MHLLLGSSMILASAALAVAVYAAFRILLAPKKAPDREAETVDVVNEVAQLGQRLSTIELRQNVTSICVKARRLLNQLTDSKDSSAEATFLIRQYLEQTRNGLRLFIAERSRVAQPRSESEKVLAQLVSTVSDRFDNLQTSLDTQDDQALAGELKLLTKTLTDLDQISVTLGQGNS